MTTNQISRVAADDVLTSIYRMCHDEGLIVIAARLVERQQVSAASMSAMLRRLREGGLVEFNEGHQIALTRAGLDRAEMMVRRHRLAECFLIEMLGLEWWRAYDEAHLMEHAISPIVEPLLHRQLGFPSTSPFGYPIPGLAPDESISRRTLGDLSPGETGTVERVFEEDTELLRYFDASSLRPGAAVKVCERSVRLGMVRVEVAGREHAFATHVESSIWIEDPGLE